MFGLTNWSKALSRVCQVPQLEKMLAKVEAFWTCHVFVSRFLRMLPVCFAVVSGKRTSAREELNCDRWFRSWAGPPGSVLGDVWRYTIYWEESTNSLPNLGGCLTAALMKMSQKPLVFQVQKTRKTNRTNLCRCVRKQKWFGQIPAFCSYAKWQPIRFHVACFRRKRSSCKISSKRRPN